MKFKYLINISSIAPLTTSLFPTVASTEIIERVQFIERRLQDLAAETGLDYAEIRAAYLDWVATTTLSSMDGIVYCRNYYRRAGRLPWDVEG